MRREGANSSHIVGPGIFVKKISNLSSGNELSGAPPGGDFLIFKWFFFHHLTCHAFL
uniref:Uncharacterized protein n=1 Tax=Anguilla anguilla TaxID=7936 RepID=A0A0E9S9N6_ANGAN